MTTHRRSQIRSPPIWAIPSSSSRSLYMQAPQNIASQQKAEPAIPAAPTVDAPSIAEEGSIGLGWSIQRDLAQSYDVVGFRAVGGVWSVRYSRSGSGERP